MDRKTLMLFTAGGLLLALALAFFVSPKASESPDGLERVAEDQGFIDEEQEHALADSPLADYQVEGVENESLSTGLSGVAGVLATFGLGLLVVGGIRWMKRPSKSGNPSA